MKHTSLCHLFLVRKSVVLSSLVGCGRMPRYTSTGNLLFGAKSVGEK